MKEVAHIPLLCSLFGQEVILCGAMSQTDTIADGAAYCEIQAAALPWPNHPSVQQCFLLIQ